MIMVKVLRTFRDAHLGAIFRYRTVVPMDAERAESLADMGYVQILERTENEEPDTPKKTKKKAKKE